MPKTDLSFEYFPPKTERGSGTLLETVGRLDALDPRFVSVTYGAGGSEREPTLNAIRAIRSASATRVASHLTCVGQSAAAVDRVARALWAEGIGKIVALRGDPPQKGAAGVVLHPNGYRHAADLVAGLKRIADFEISVAAFPEGHPESDGPAADIENLKRKVDAGADRAITQFFFDTEAFLRYRDAAAKAGIGIEIVPGILPIQNIHTLLSFSEDCGAHVPGWLVDAFDGTAGDGEAAHKVARDIAACQVDALRTAGVDAFHFYTLNRAELTLDVCAACGIAPEQRAAA